MKKKIYFLILIFFIFKITCLSQINPFSGQVRLTYGHNDRNPTFKKDRWKNHEEEYSYEFMVYERVTGNSSQIFVSKIGESGAMDSGVDLTNDLFVNKNPSISYHKPRYFILFTIKYAMVVWETNKFGRQSIFGCTYRSSTGWSSPFIIDSSGNNSTPQVVCFDSTNYAITYKSGGDIKYLRYNLLLHSFFSKQNITLTDSLNCSNPYIFYYDQIFSKSSLTISYEKEISQTQRAIFYRTGGKDSIPSNENSSDTIAYSGINTNKGFARIYSYCGVFEANRNGKINIYATTFFDQNNHQFRVIENNSFNNTNYVGTDYSITDLSDTTNAVFAYIRKSTSGVQLILKSWFPDPVLINISNFENYQSKIGLNNSIRVQGALCFRYWFVYNKDSSNMDFPSTIYGVYFTNCLANINSYSPNNPGEFILYQNFPNPFNPKTNINYSIPTTQYTILKVYDILGNEIALLVNENQNAGSYSVEFDASNSPSGIYYYKLEAGDFSEVRKMVLIR